MPEQLFGQLNDQDRTISNKMNSYRFFLEEPGSWTSVLGKTGITMLCGGVGIMYLLLLIGYVNGGVFNKFADNIVGIILILASILGIVLMLISCYRPPLLNAFILSPSGSLWCFMSKEQPSKVAVSRKEMINEREKILGPSKDLTNDEICRLINVLNYMEAIELGNNVDFPCELDMIEDIETIENNEKDNVTTITYTDKFSSERRKISLDNYKWSDFLEWLHEKRKEYE